MALKVRQNADTFNPHHRQGGVYPREKIRASKSDIYPRKKHLHEQVLIFSVFF